jgi:HSP20 family protein
VKRNTPSGYTPVALVSELRRELERLVHELLVTSESLPQPGDWCPPADVVDDGERILVCLEVPGLGPEDLEVEVEGGVVHVRGRRRQRYAAEVRYHCLERQEGGFERQLQMPEAVDFGLVRARLSRGVLSIELPKVEDRRRRRRAVAVEADEENEP